MLYIHTSNKLEQLAEEYAKVVKKPLQNVLEPETVVVQNIGMGRWLSMFMANAAGISANTEFLLPAQYMWRLLRFVSSDIPEQSQCSPETLRFFIMSELTEHPDNYPELHHYIYTIDTGDETIDEIACWELACELAQLFDQYLFYRSDWIHQWESADPAAHNNTEKNVDWQARLWQRCVKDNELVHWLALQDQFKSSIIDFDTQALPARISFFSMSALSPGYLDLLGELAKKTDIHLYVINPCGEIYWGDIQSERSRSKLKPIEQQVTEVGNPLLASMGKQGRDFIAKLYDLPDAQENTLEYKEADNDSLLNQLQQDIYQLIDPKQKRLEKDNSIQFNACHTAMREVEVLHDQILNILDQDADIAPSDIVVMMPDVENHAPYIEAVFSSSKQKLPFSIADHKPTDVFHIIEALNKLLMLNDSRFDVESVFELLDYEEIYSRFDLNEAQISQCRGLARATNIRWGISAETRHDDDLPNSEEHTWKYALDRLLLGFTMGSHPQSEQLFDSERLLSLLPFDDIEGNDAIMLASFKQFTDTVFTINNWHGEHHSLNAWIEKTRALILRLFSEKANTSKILTSLDALNNNAKLANFEQTLSFSVFKKTLQECLQNISGPEKFLGHGITFCALVPMRSVPFKVVALMGMNDGEFPRQDKHHSFDLMANKPRRGDRSRRNEDRYLFLESILAARSQLLISYCGQSIKDNSELPPSVLVSELLDTLVSYTEIPVEHWICKHPLQAFSPRYFDNSKNELFSYASEYTSLHKSTETDLTKSDIFIKDRLPELDDSYKKLSLNDLISFYQSPARSFLKQRFDIQTYDEDVTLPVREPFELEFFKDREIRNLIQQGSSQELTNQELSNEQILIARAKGLLPYGDIGDEIFNTEKQIIDNFNQHLPEIEYQESTHFTLNLGDFSLHGELTALTATGRLVKQVTQPYFRDYIDLWINHLALNAQAKNNAQTINQNQKQSTLYSPEISFNLSPVIDAKEQLQQLVNNYWEGLHFPLSFYPKAAFSMYEGKCNGDAIHKKGIDSWNGSSYKSGDKEKFENNLLYCSDEMTEQNIPDELLKTGKQIFGEMYSKYSEL